MRNESANKWKEQIDCENSSNGLAKKLNTWRYTVSMGTYAKVEKIQIIFTPLSPSLPQFSNVFRWQIKFFSLFTLCRRICALRSLCFYTFFCIFFYIRLSVLPSAIPSCLFRGVCHFSSTLCCAVCVCPFFLSISYTHISLFDEI